MLRHDPFVLSYITFTYPNYYLDTRQTLDGEAFELNRSFWCDISVLFQCYHNNVILKQGWILFIYIG